MQRLLTLLIATVTLAAGPCRGGELELTWFTIDGGGGRSGGGGHLLEGAIGQPDLGASTGGTFALEGGYLAPAAPASVSCPGDVNTSGGVDTTDLIEVVVNWGLCFDPPCPADLNDDGEINVEDLVLVVLNWGPCP